MLTFRSILDALRELGLSCIGSPHSRSRQLAALKRLDAHLLNDIGLTPEQVQGAEALQDLSRPAARLPMGQPSLNR
jgi:uncharacterized protein YjiS (DUF1127 family)